LPACATRHQPNAFTQIMNTASSPIDTDELEVRHSDIHGRGTFARRGMPPGHFVGTYEGRRYAPTEENERPWDHALTYVFGLSDGTLIDGAEGGNATRHINHSCAPNCQASEEPDDDGELHIVIRTRRRVRAGEELFIDYRLDVGGGDPSDYPCRCGAAACRGTMAAAEAQTA
jgi:SET domain-containing protein